MINWTVIAVRAVIVWSCFTFSFGYAVFD